MMDRKKVLELDKICRVCISERKDMRPLFSERVAEMLMDFTSVVVEPIEGWPDKICVQCVHSVSRCHAFKMLVERSDKDLREYIKSLTVRVIIEDPPAAPQVKQETQQQQQQELKLQQNQAKLLDLQQQRQEVLLQQQLVEKRKQKQQRMLEKQQQVLLQQQQEEAQQKLLLEKRQQQEQQQQLLLQQQQQKKAKAAAARKVVRNNKKSPQQVQQQQSSPLQHQHQQQQQQQQPQHQPTQIQIQQPQQIIIQQSPQQTLPEPIAIHAVNAMAASAQHHQQQQQQQQALQTQQILPATTTTALPQQIVLPNGQIITTAQIVTTAGPPQIAQIINTAPQAPTTTPQQPQFTPQLIQTTSGQTLQIIQQPNGQQTLQLVQLVPQRTLATVSGNIVDDTEVSIVDDDVLIEQCDQHMIDNDEDDDTDEKEQICETIVVEEEQLMHQNFLAVPRHQTITIEDDNFSQGETQELEYLEDITVTTTHNQHLHDEDSGGHLMHEEEDEDDIIEEIHMEEEMLDDEDSSVMHVMDASGAEFITDDHHHLVSDCNSDGAVELQYTVMEAVGDENDDVLDEVDVQACVGNNHIDATASHLEFDAPNAASIGSQTSTLATPKKTRRTNANNATGNTNSSSHMAPSAKALANSRQLAATASSIASEDGYEIDAKLVSEFISQQTTSLGSGRYVCNLCRQDFKQFKGLQNHMYLHANWIRANCKKQPQCEICFKSFKGPGMLKMHMKTHQSAARTPTCNICGKSFKSKPILYRHRQIHQLRAFACGVDNCRRSFSTIATLRSHIERKHASIARSRYKCSECSMLFDDGDTLEAHVDMSGHGGVAVDTGTTVVEFPDGSTTLDESIASGNVIVVTQA